MSISLPSFVRVLVVDPLPSSLTKKEFSLLFSGLSKILELVMDVRKCTYTHLFCVLEECGDHHELIFTSLILSEDVSLLKGTHSQHYLWECEEENLLSRTGDPSQTSWCRVKRCAEKIET